jgi:hypothetical protein
MWFGRQWLKLHVFWLSAIVVHPDNDRQELENVRSDNKTLTMRIPKRARSRRTTRSRARSRLPLMKENVASDGG